MIVTIHQPEHLIWLGLIRKIYDADVFVIMDSVQYSHGNVQNRNKIRTKEGWEWVTVPTVKHPLATKIRDIQISYDVDWQRKYLNTLKTNYGAATFFNEYFSEIEKIVLKNHQLLAELNIELIMFLLKSFGIHDKKIMKLSEMDIGSPKGGSDIILAICKKIGSDHYLAGSGGRSYMKLDDFEREGIKVTFHEFHHPSYTQLYDPFLPYMSSIDLLFNHGPEAREILLKS